MRAKGFNSSQMALFLDCTKSNENKEQRAFPGYSLHDVSRPEVRNPYQQVINILCPVLAEFDDDGLIPLFGFGDQHSKDDSVFSFRKDGAPCEGMEGILAAYYHAIPRVVMSGPTCFAPAIRRAVDLYKAAKKKELLICVILADGQVTQPKETDKAVVEANRFPISIISEEPRAARRRAALRGQTNAPPSRTHPFPRPPPPPPNPHSGGRGGRPVG
jgi:E3 ubiquitin-protein ligase RGLG